MSTRKGRVTVTVDRDLLEFGNEAVAAGRASSLSTWVNTALAERAAKERRLRAMAEVVSAYEAEFGEISPAELLAQQRDDRRRSIAVREKSTKPVRRRRMAA
jgi:hypothetical protein